MPRVPRRAQRLELLVPPFRSRPYAGAADLDLLIAFARQATAARLPGLSYLHPGDMVWALVPYPELATPENVHLWFGDSRLAAYVLFEPPVTFQFDVRPGLVDGDRLTAEVLAWAEGRWSELETGGEPDSRVPTRCSKGPSRRPRSKVTGGVWNS